MDHPVTKRFRAVPHSHTTQGRKEFVQATILFSCWGIGIGMFQLIPSLGFGLLGACVAGSILLLPIPLLIGYSIRTAMTDMARMHESDVNALGHPLDTECYVGICYVDAIVEKGLDSSLDRGWLSIYSGVLFFRGHVSSFQLPLSILESISLVKTDRYSTMHLPRILIRWKHPQGTTESILLEVRIGRSFREIRRETRALVDWFSRSLSSKEEAEIDERYLPVRSDDLDKAILYRSNVSTIDDHLVAIRVALVVCTFIFGVYWGIATLLGREMNGGLIAAIGVMVTPIYVGTLSKRQRERKDDDS
jgi:hypothetical protein